VTGHHENDGNSNSLYSNNDNRSAAGKVEFVIRYGI